MRPFFRRPEKAERDRWENLRKTVEARKAIAKKKPEELTSRDFEPAWHDDRWKNAVAEAQDSLCAWCTRKPSDGGSDGVFDHVRPKAEVHRKVGAKGREVGPLKKVRDRNYLPEPPVRPGYYWRAYDPENLVFCCDKCNRSWKKNLWPVKPFQGPWKAPNPGEKEEELVLDPFDASFDPLAHFRFGDMGVMIARQNDERAEATIETLGLDRQSLCDERRKVYDQLQADVSDVERALREGPIEATEERKLWKIAEACAWSSPHAAFARAALKKMLKKMNYTWSDFSVIIWNRLGIPAPKAPPDDVWID